MDIILFLIFKGSAGLITIGKISYNPKDLIGRGCEGTAVYK